MGMTLLKKFRNICLFFLVFSFVLPPVTAHADTSGSKSTGIKYAIQAEGAYSNWEGVSNVSQFLDNNGDFCFAYYNKKTVTIVKTKNGKPVKKKITLNMSNPLFGGVACDSSGNYYLVSGKTNNSSNRTQNTVFVSKYDKNGTLLKTAGDNGSSSLGSWYSNDFYTKIPFDGGNCDIAVNGNYLAVNYAREMYSGHQSNSVFVINTTDMTKVNPGNIYSSHSFAQRAIPYKEGFVFASEGDCYDRAFTISALTDPSSGTVTTGNSFHFWVQKGALDAYNMYVLNDNFAHMGALTAVGSQTVALVGSSVKSLDQKAASESEQLFIQIFDPTKDLSTSSAYVTSGTRSGYGGPNGDQKVTDYGVKWLTNYASKFNINYPQAVSDGKGNTIILYELYANSSYKGVYYLVVDQNGKISTKKTKYSSTAHLNPCETPDYANNTVYWVGHSTKKTNNTMYVYSLKLS